MPSRAAKGSGWRSLGLALCLLFAALTGALAEDPGPTPDLAPDLTPDLTPDLIRRLKVAYLYNFTRFVDWPRPPADGAFVIAVIGDDRLAQDLRLLEREDRRVAGVPIRIRRIATAAQIGDAHILFIGTAAATKLPAILEAVAGRPVLLVGDTPGLAGRGVAINFFLKPDILGEGQRLRFAIDPRALKGRGLKVSARLYDVAEVLR